MRFLLDKSADFPLATYLRSLGHDVTAIAHDYTGALTDVEVLAIVTILPIVQNLPHLFGL